MDEGGSNRRRFRRVMNPAATYRPPAGWRFEKVMDISPGGMRVLAPDCLEAGDRLPLELQLPDGIRIELWAKVASTQAPRELGAGCESGLRFTDIPDNDRLRLARIPTLSG